MAGWRDGAERHGLHHLDRGGVRGVGLRLGELPLSLQPGPTGGTEKGRLRTDATEEKDRPSTQTY